MPKNKLLKIIWKIFKISIDKAAEFDYNMNVINKTEKHQKQTIKKDEVKSMKIEVQNNIPGVKVSVNQNADGSFAILLAEMAGKTLGSVKPGDTVTIGEREYIVLGHGEETTAIIAKKPTKSMAFGKDGDYTKSDVRTYCNGEFYKELCKAVGKHNIILTAFGATEPLASVVGKYYYSKFNIPAEPPTTKEILSKIAEKWDSLNDVEKDTIIAMANNSVTV